MSKLLFDEAPLVVDTVLATKIGVDAALVLQQVHYWVEINRKKNSNFHDGAYWTYNTIKDWNKCFPFYGERTIQRIFKKLKDLGILKVGNFNKAKFDKTSWYSIDYDKLNEIVEGSKTCNASRQNGVIEDTKSVNDNDKMAERERQNGVTTATKGVNEDDKMAEPIPEISTEIITETSTEISNNTKIQSEIVCDTDVSQSQQGADIQRIIDEWNANKYLPKVQRLVSSTERYKMLNCRIKQYGFEAVLQAVHNISQSDFLQGLKAGSNGKVFHLTFDWFVRPNNFPKVLEGNYTNKELAQSSISKQGNKIYQGDGYSVEDVESSSKSVFDELREIYGE